VVRESYTITKTLDHAATRTAQRPRLHRLDLELTERCNNNCLHCYLNRPANDHLARERELSTTQLQAILDEAATLGCLTLRFTGGEPLLRPDFAALYLHARRLGFRVSLSTNATLITPHLADLLARLPPLQPLDITVYGMTAGSYEAVSRVPGSFHRFWRGVNLLLQRGVALQPRFALLPPNASELQTFERWALSLPGVQRHPGIVLFLDLRARPESERSRELAALRCSPEEGVAVLARRGAAYQDEMRSFCARFSRPAGDFLFACGAGRESACLDACGNLQPCVQLRHPAALYNLVQAQPASPLRHAMTEFFPRMRQLRATNPDYLLRCARCFLKGLCDQCPAKSWMEHGTLDTPVEYLCAVAHAKARHLGLLAQGENAWQVEDWRERIENFSKKEQT